MEKNHYSIMRNKTLASMIFVPAIPFISLVIIGYYYFVTSLHTETISKMTRIVEDHRQMIESFLTERKSDLQFIANSYTFPEIIKEDILNDVFTNLQKKSNAFTDIGIFNQNGIHVAYHGPYKLAGKIYKETIWFKWVLEKGLYISDVFLGYRRIPHFIVAVLKQDKGTTWVIRATIDTSFFSDVVEKVRIGKTGEAYILNKNGVFQTQRRSGGSLMDKDTELKGSFSFHDGVKTFVEKAGHGEEYLYATTWLSNHQWLLVVRLEKAEAFKALTTVTYLVILVTIIGGIMIISMAFYVTNRLINRMEHIDTEKKELGQQLVVAGRLAEIGEMSAGFAHEINNPLQIIRVEQTLIETILSDLKDKGELNDSDDLKELLDSMHQIKLQVDRCAEITQALLKFARQKESQSREIDLRFLVPEVIRLVKTKANVEGIIIKQEIPEHIPLVNADPTQLQQVLVNLFNNAIDAIIEKHGHSGGELMVEVQSPSDQDVIITVTDNGCGISHENMEKIFTPFFTTKPVGKGTGLGLSICYGIIAKMDGVMEVSSEKGKGTTFTINLKAM